MNSSRVQLALNVNDLEEAIAFYGKLFDATPHKRRDGYANFAITDPPLKLVLIENPGAEGGLNHLGVEVRDTQHVMDAAERFKLEQMQTFTEEGVDCCYAVADKVWVTSPEGERWEVYTVLDEDGTVSAMSGAAAVSGCCTDATEVSTSQSAACC